MNERPESKWFLLSRHLSREASEEESAELFRLLREDPALQQQFELLAQLWQPGNETAAPANPDKISRILQLSELEPVMNDVEEEKESTVSAPPVRRFPRFYRSAAAVLLLISAGWLAFQLWPGQNKQAGEIVAVNGSRTRAILPDGSTVWLNAGSKISYIPGFNEKTREVILNGEAYFDIIKQPDRPFIVHAGAIDIKVLGTAFNVKSYPEDKTVETTLIRGLVQINHKNQSAPIFLKPHQKIILPAVAGNESRPQTVVGAPATGKSKAVALPLVSNLDSSLREDEYIETAWVFNRLEFRGDRFADLARKLERWYNITIHFEDEKAKSLQFNGSLENETVEQALHALQTAVPFEFTIKGNEIYIETQDENIP